MMTKLKTTVLMSIVLFMASCSSNKVLTQADTLVGAYDKSTTITDEEFSLFKTVMQSHSDLQLKPIKVSRQVVAGTNYKYECINENKRTVEVVIFQPLPGQGEARILSVNPKLTLNKHSQTNSIIADLDSLFL